MAAVRVLHLLDQISCRSGVSAVVMNLLRQANRQRYLCDVAAHKPPDPSLVQEILDCGGQYYQLPDITPKSLGDYRKAVRVLLERERYPILHGHIANAGFLYLREAKRLNVPIRIIHAHNAAGAATAVKRIRNRLLNSGIGFWANEYIACSDLASAYLFGNSAKLATLLPNGADCNKFRFDPSVRHEVRLELGIGAGTSCVGHIGRLDAQKNQHFLLAAFAEYRRRVPDSLLVIAGDGPLKLGLKQKSDALELGESVRFLGLRDDPHRLCQAFDQFWLPSHFEGWPVVAVEAQAAGLPCVLSNAITEQAAVLDTSVRLPVNNPQEWARRCARITPAVERESRADEIRESGLDISAIAQKLMELYDVYLQEAGLE